MAKKVRLISPTTFPGQGSLKDRRIAELVAARRNLIDLVTTLSPEQREEVFLGEWSVKELIAHLIGWDRTYVAAVQDLRASELPGFYAAYDEDWQSYNRNLVQEYLKGDWQDLLAAAKQSHSDLIGYLRTLTEDEFEQDWGVRFRGTPVTISRLIDAEIKDDREHLGQIKAWVGSE